MEQNACSHNTRDGKPNLDLLKPQTFGFRAAIFDLDGTVVDSRGVWDEVDRDFFAARNLNFDPEFARNLSVLGFEEGARFSIERYGLAESVDDICKEWNALGEAHYRTRVMPIGGACDYIRALQSCGIRTALATTNDPNVVLALEPRVAISELFPIRVHGCEVEHHSKNDPDIYLEALSRLGVSARECVLFEDLAPAIRTGKRLGLFCVAYLGRSVYQKADDIQTCADIPIDSWWDLLR